jgi:hypothetical protein
MDFEKSQGASPSIIDESEQKPIEIRGNIPINNKREARLQAILEAEALASQSLLPIIKKSNLL